MNSVEFLKGLKKYFIALFKTFRFYIISGIIIILVIGVAVVIYEKITGKTYGEESNEEQSKLMMIDDTELAYSFTADKIFIL